MHQSDLDLPQGKTPDDPGDMRTFRTPERIQNTERTYIFESAKEHSSRPADISKL